MLVSVRRCLLPAKGSSIRHTSFRLWFREGLADALVEAQKHKLSNSLSHANDKEESRGRASVVEKAQFVQDNGTVNALTTCHHNSRNLTVTNKASSDESLKPCRHHEVRTPTRLTQRVSSNMLRLTTRHLWQACGRDGTVTPR